MAQSEHVGKPLNPQRVVIERGPVSNFATAVKDDNPIYANAEAAKRHGFDDVPAPPTWAFAMTHWGALPEIQPEGADKPNPMMEAIGSLMQQGGMVLHGEQEFIYHRPAQVGDVLTSEGRIADVYEKQLSSVQTMPLVVSETDWNDEQGEPVVTTVTTLLHRA
jgi:acyl dehydratase